MRKKSPCRALLWLLLIPGQIVVGTAFVALGAYMDSVMFSHPAPDTMGHGMPVFSLIFAIVAFVVTIIIVILSIIITIVRASAINRNNKMIMSGVAYEHQEDIQRK